MPGKLKTITVREEEIDVSGNKTGWVKTFRAFAPDCDVSKALYKAKGIIEGYSPIPDTEKWTSPEGITLTEKERREKGGAIQTKSRDEAKSQKDLAEALKALTSFLQESLKSKGGKN